MSTHTEVRLDKGEVGSERDRFVARAFALEWMTLAWVVIEAAAGIYSGVQASSVSLTAFGLDSLIETASASLLLWRLDKELRHGQHFSKTAERQASRIGGGLLFALAVYVVVAAVWNLWTGRGEEFSTVGLAVTAATIPVMYVLSKKKLAIAQQIGSKALRADAMESLTCGWLSTVVLFGLIVQLLGGWWWVDAVTSLGIVWLLIREGREAWRGDDCCGHG